VYLLGGGYMRSREARAFAEDNGYLGWSAYFAGRFGVLGPVPSAVVQAAAGFFPARTVEVAWALGQRVQPLAAATAGYQSVMANWAHRRLDGFDGAERLAELLERVVDGADPAGAALFAAWRAAERPKDPVEQVVQLAHVLREHRGGAHLVAVLASGLTPLEAVVAGPCGVAHATYFGWPPPYPEPSSGLAARHSAAESLTNVLAGPAYDVLSAAEAEELAALLSVAAQGLRPPLG
jgi:hypothetical protein